MVIYSETGKWSTNKAQTIIKGASSVNRLNKKYHGKTDISHQNTALTKSEQGFVSIIAIMFTDQIINKLRGGISIEVKSKTLVIRYCLSRCMPIHIKTDKKRNDM